jgi:hypothetical protein
MIYLKLAALLFIQVGGFVASIALLFAAFMHLPLSLIFVPVSLLLLAVTLYLALKVGPDLLGQID